MIARAAVTDGAVYVLFLNAADSGDVSDLDGDTVRDDIENSHPNNGDGNRDGVPDQQQAHVVSLPSVKNGTYVTTAVPVTTGFGYSSAEEEPEVHPAMNGISLPVRLPRL